MGAALLTKSGEIIGGANVESASYGLTRRAVQGVDGRAEKFHRGRGRRAVRRRADAVRRVPAVAARACTGREGFHRGQR